MGKDSGYLMDLRIYKILENTKVEGPDNRFCIWVQGCKKHCEGCWAENTWNFDGGELLSVDKIFNKISKTKDIQGVTFLGGEPFEQAEALALLAKKIKEINLSLVVFTGYIWEELLELNDKNINDLLSYTDLLIDGPFEANNFDLTRPWVGSTNKRYIFLTDKYSFEDIKDTKNKIEVRIDKMGGLFINGMGDFEKIQKSLYLHYMENKVYF